MMNSYSAHQKNMTRLTIEAHTLTTERKIAAKRQKSLTHFTFLDGEDEVFLKTIICGAFYKLHRIEAPEI